jgi:acyl-CoA thioesterase-1
MIGANDFADAFRDVLAHRRSSTDAFPPVAKHVQRWVTAEIRKIKQLHPGIHVIVAGYWNVMKDGKVGLRTYGSWGEAKAVEATLDADAGLHNAAVATHSTYVSTYYPFKGYDGKRDPTRLLAADGDHPNATGHAVIANAIYRAAPRG